ncbi:OmpA family protein [Catalinimonas sp. 4WD22]|uniref:OmpA family protein n=1 Tax=Catalinimonas locisalis TaxID=3133978 RepID=UPI003101149A
MKTLIFGTLAFLAWSSFSTHYYVCQIKNLCLEDSPLALAEPVQQNEEEVSLIEAPASEVTETPVANPGSFTLHHNFNDVSFISLDGFEDYLQQLKAYAEQTPTTIKVIGFTDDKGTNDYNLELGEKRAEAVKNYLVEYGLDANLITVETKGEADPESTDETTEGRAMNRRTLIVTE